MPGRREAQGEAGPAMRIFTTRRVVALACALVVQSNTGWSAAAAAERPYDADVLIQAGHEGRPDCSLEPASLCNNTGTPGEMALNATVANQATRLLQAAGINVLRKPAYLAGTYRVRDAIFIHFDGNATPCTTRASVGYPNVAHSADVAQEWKRLFSRQWRWGYQADNFTKNLRDYYAYKHVIASDAELVIEGGEITCPPQLDWVREHLNWEAGAIAYLVSQRLHKGHIPPPH